MVQFISVDFFFFITNINTTFPLNSAWLFRIKNPALNSLVRLVLLGSAFEFTLTVTLTFLVERSPGSFPIRNSDLPHCYTLEHERGIGAICREFNQTPNLWETKNRENTRQRKNNHTYKTVFTWFGNLPTFMKLQGFYYY